MRPGAHGQRRRGARDDPARGVGGVDECGEASDALRENAYEAFNIAASIFDEVDETEVHVKLRELVVGPPIAPAVLATFAKPVTRLDIDVTAPDYPVGKLALLAPRHGIGPRPSGRS